MAKQEYHFTVIIEPCEEGGFYGECPSLPGCHVQGESYEETLSELRHAIAGVVADLQKNGEEIPSDSVTVTSLHVAA
ncbi:MAG: type II toxin-antitoxin system HicB family antitoxin [Deltaproteobacteria bacterium]|nr:type II toxin-antitoxin system HicB family antitoxin [Deltaproteobacteria bacterium]